MEEASSLLLPELREELYKWKVLLENPGWKLLERYAAAQREGRVNDLLLSVETRTKEVHYTRGELAGIKLFCEIPLIEIRRIEQEIENRSKQIEETQDEPIQNDVPPSP